MVIKFLKLNAPKTELLLIGSHYGAVVPCSHIQIGNEKIPSSVPARNLGVTFHICMTLEAHVNSVVRQLSILHQEHWQYKKSPGTEGCSYSGPSICDIKTGLV